MMMQNMAHGVSRTIASLAAAVVLVTGTASFAAGPFRQINVGNWHGGSYTNDQTGRFSHCAVQSDYNSGITFFVAVSDNYTWRLGFFHRSWNFIAGSTVPLDLTFDGRGRTHLNASVKQPNLVVLECRQRLTSLHDFERPIL
jgi:hypothetical protein